MFIIKISINTRKKDVRTFLEQLNSILSDMEFDINKFKNFKAKDIVEYMHQERAYLETQDGKEIPFSLARNMLNRKLILQTGTSDSNSA